MEKLLITHLIKRIAIILNEFSCKLKSISERLQSINKLNSSTKKILNRNIRFKDIHKGKRAFVIVNGPSLKAQNLELLENELTFVVSGFYKHEVIKKWQPTYYSILDKAFFDGSESSKSFFKEINRYISKSIFFIPLFRGYNRNQELGLLPDKSRVFYIATAGTPNQNIDMTSVVQSFQSVSAFSLSQAIYMGCSPIYLLGFDHDYLANRGFEKHFYEGNTIPGLERKNKPLSEMFPYDGEMMSCYKLWQNYKSLKLIAEKKNIEILNATNGGYLDVFPRVEFEKIIQN